MDMAKEKIKVLYIAGLGRSGSTILGNVIGQMDGFFSAGELGTILDRGVIQNRLCGCGVRFRDCEVWQGVINVAFGGMDRINAERMIQRRERGARTRHFPLMVFPGGRAVLRSRLSSYLGSLEKLYGAIRSTTGCRVIVDSSKGPSYARALEMIPTIDLYVLHLIRDARATAFSTLRKRLHPDPKDRLYLPRHTPLGNSIRWTVLNLGAEVGWKSSRGRYLMVRYEDFIERPQESVSQIVGFLREKEQSSPFASEHAVQLGRNHNVWANPSRFRTGTVELRLDNEWMSSMGSPDRMIVTLMTWPLLLRYGYSLKPWRAR